jgi:hypothetical protein
MPTHSAPAEGLVVGQLILIDPALEALRRTMLVYMADGSDPRSVYPGYWGPFSVVGEGAAWRPPGLFVPAPK